MQREENKKKRIETIWKRRLNCVKFLHLKILKHGRRTWRNKGQGEADFFIGWNIKACYYEENKRKQRNQGR